MRVGGRMIGGVTIVLAENKKVDCQIQSSFYDQHSVSQLLFESNQSWKDPEELALTRMRLGSPSLQQ
jgi:hypothetical protein